jgi:isopentenyl phosphate kinase
MKNLILVKLGGSLITDKTKSFTPRLDAIKRLAGEIHEARNEGKIKIILGHGGGSFPHKPAKDYKTNEGIISKESYRGISLVQEAAIQLNRIIVKSLIDVGENAISVQPSAGLITENGRIKEWYLGSIREMLRHDLLPVTYGDVALDIKRGCCIVSTEEILNYLAKHLDSKRIILAGMVDGVFTSDPQKNPDAVLIPEINSKNYNEVKKYLGGSAGIDVTGGMITKIDKMFELVNLGVEIVIINGEKEGYLKRTLLGENVPGTIIRT